MLNVVTPFLSLLRYPRKPRKVRVHSAAFKLQRMS
jgi:hypothetical protein